MRQLVYFYKSDVRAAASAPVCQLQDEPLDWGVLGEGPKSCTLPIGGWACLLSRHLEGCSEQPSVVTWGSVKADTC